MEDKLTYYDIGNYRIEFKRTNNPFSYSPYSQFKFSIIFKDKITDLVLIEINTNEKRMYEFVVDMYQYNTYISGTQMTFIFDQDTNGNVFNIEAELTYPDFPTELELSQVTIFQHNRYTDNYIARLSIVMDEFQIEDMIYQAWSCLQGITYLAEIGRSELDDDYLDFLVDNMDQINSD